MVKYIKHKIYYFNHFFTLQFSALNTFTLFCNHYHHPSLGVFHLSKLKLCTPNLPCPSPWQPPFYFLSIWLFEVPHISRIIQYLSFCDLLLSISIMSPGFLHVIACVRISSLRWDNIPLYVDTTFSLSFHLLMDIGLLPPFGYSDPHILLWFTFYFMFYYFSPHLFYVIKISQRAETSSSFFVLHGK